MTELVFRAIMPEEPSNLADEEYAMVNAQGLLLMAGVGGVLVLWSIPIVITALRSTDPSTYQRDLQEGCGLFITGMSLCLLAGMIRYAASSVTIGWDLFVGAFIGSALFGLILIDNAHRGHRRRTCIPIPPPSI
jgi:hypothetical protein